MSDQTQTRKGLEQAIARRAIMDPAFRDELLADPRSAVQAVLTDEAPGAKLPDNLEVKAFQEPTNAFYVIVPTMPTDLSEADLEAVAGGGFCINIQGHVTGEIDVKAT
jgi:hypothetical protein